MASARVEEPDAPLKVSFFKQKGKIIRPSKRTEPLALCCVYIMRFVVPPYVLLSTTEASASHAGQTVTKVLRYA